MGIFVTIAAAAVITEATGLEGSSEALWGIAETFAAVVARFITVKLQLVPDAR